jgi:Metallo-peptidase family M12B Reprolysin-like
VRKNRLSPRELLALIGLVSIGVVLPAAAQSGAPTPAPAPAVPAPVVAVAPRQPDARGVRGRLVGEVVAELRTNRRVQAAVDQGLLDVADDPNAYVDSGGNIFFVEFATAESTARSTAPQPEQIISNPTPDQAFLLHSRPGSTRTIYVDFDGETVSNNYWTLDANVASKTVTPFSLDANPGFSQTELNFIVEAWQSTAEDYAPFDVDVTTQRPAATAFSVDYPGDPVFGAIAVVTNDKWLCTGNCLGIAYFDAFANTIPQNVRAGRSPAWAFTDATSQPYEVGVTVTHEIGHNFGLRHDGFLPSTNNYYAGHGDWSPIMGSVTSRLFTQWSKGEYTNANNTQDDIGIIANTVGYVEDLQGSTLATAQPLPVVASQVTPQTTIRAADDFDLYRIDNTNYINAIFVGAPYDQNLLASFNILNNAGTVVASSLSSFGYANVSYIAPTKGTYYLQVAPSASLTPSTGFSTYGSLGVYSLDITQIDPPTSVASVQAIATADGQITATWTPATALSLSAQIQYEVSVCNAASVCSSPIVTSATNAVFNNLVPGTGYYVTVRPFDQSLISTPATASSTVLVLARPTSPTPQKIRYIAAPAPTLTVEWSGAVSYTNNAIISTTWVIQNQSTSEQISGFLDAASSSAGTITQVIPVSWNNANVVVTITSTGSAPAPFAAALPKTGSIFIGRQAAPQSPTPVAPTTVRGPAPQAPGVTVPRGAAPQA